MDNQLRYNYVFFNTLDGHIYKDYPNGYYAICAEELKDHPKIELVSAPLYYCPKVIRKIFAVHNSIRINNFISLPFKNIWFPFYFRDKDKQDLPYCFILLNHQISIAYLKYLKQRYPTCRIVVLHRDLAAVCNKVNPELSGNPIVDLEMTYDPRESRLYGWPYFSEFESKIDIFKSAEPESDVFFAGRAKGRLSDLLKAYEVCSKAGLKIFYYLTGVDKKDRNYLPGIIYADKGMSYREMLEHTVNTRCVLEINYGSAKGYTSRFLESVIYGKKLITNNAFIKESPFYSSNNIQYVPDMSLIDTDFITKQPAEANYHYNNEFSPINMIERVDEELCRKFK